MSEKALHRSVCQYLRIAYPDVLFNTDLSGSGKLTIGQATALKSLRSNRGFPDIAIYEPIGHYHGLFIELKKDGEKLYNKDHLPKTPHIKEQFECNRKLRAKGYYAAFSIGFDQAKRLIDNYLNNLL